MNSGDLITAVIKQMKRLDVRQAELAKACALSQPHISKVLSKKVKLGPKTAKRLSDWLELSEADSASEKGELFRSLASRLEEARPYRRMQIMEFLRAFDRLLSE